MTSEIRANTLKNRVGLGTVSFTNTGPVVSGIVTATSIEVVGALTEDAAKIKIPDGMNGAPFTGNLEFGNNRDFVVLHDGHHNYVKANTGNVYITCGGNTLATLQTGGTVLLNKDLDVDGHTNLDNVNVSGATTCNGGVVFLNSISLNASSNNYLYFDDILHFSRNGHGTEMVIDASGRVGINEGTPEAKLELDGRFRILDNSDGTPSTGKGLEISYYTSDDLADILSYDRGGGSYKKLQLRGSSIELKKNNTAKIIVGTGGNGNTVGFSTTTTLVTNAEAIAVRGYSSFKSTNPAYAAIYLSSEGNTTDTANQLLMFNAGGANRGGIGYVPNTGELRFNHQYYMTFCTGSSIMSGTERLRIKSNGHIVLGSDGTNSELTFTQDGTSGTQLNATTTGSGGYNTLSINSATLIHKYGVTERLRINSAGEISVANAAPSSGGGKLNVKPHDSVDSYFKIRNAADFDGTLTGNVIDNRNSANNASRDLIIRSDKLVLWQGANEALRILDSNHIQFNGTSEEITLRTSDGSDNGYMNLSGGGACAQTRGAQLVLSGNERSSYGGLLQLLAGNSGQTEGKIQMFTGGNERLILQNGGVLSQRVNSNARLSHGILEITSSSTPSQLKITTNIPYSGSAGSHAESVTIRGFRYGGRDTVDIQICWHVYAGQFYNRIASSSGGWAPLITLGVENNKVVIHFDSLGYWHKIYVSDYYSAYNPYDYARGWTYDFNAISGDSGTPVNTVPYKNDWGGLEYNSDNAVGTNPDRHLKIVNGNLIIGTAGHGIDFSADSNASGTPSSQEILDDYEYGSWTPTNQYQNVQSRRDCKYIKIGNMVTVSFDITCGSSPADSSQTGGYIEGLPLTSASSSPGGRPGVLRIFDSYNGAASSLTTECWMYCGANANTLYIQYNSQNRGLIRAESAGKRIMGQFTYLAT